MPTLTLEALRAHLPLHPYLACLVFLAQRIADLQEEDPTSTRLMRFRHDQVLAQAQAMAHTVGGTKAQARQQVDSLLHEIRTHSTSEERRRLMTLPEAMGF